MPTKKYKHTSIWSNEKTLNIMVKIITYCRIFKVHCKWHWHGCREHRFWSSGEQTFSLPRTKARQPEEQGETTRGAKRAFRQNGYSLYVKSSKNTLKQRPTYWLTRHCIWCKKLAHRYRRFYPQLIREEQCQNMKHIHNLIIRQDYRPLKKIITSRRLKNSKTSSPPH